MKKNNIYNKVKTIALAAAVATVGTGMTTSCGDWLELEPHNEITQENFWTQSSDVQDIISGTYLKIESNEVLSRMMVWGDFRADNITYNGTVTAEKDIALDNVLKENINASNVYTAWNDFYNVINRCNIVMHYAPQVAEKDPSYSPGELNAHIAEATALRSLMYFYLIRTFRDVPYVEEAYLDDSKPQKLAQTDFYTVLNNLIASLKSVEDKAFTEFPASDNANEKKYSTGRVTKPFIWAMLSEMYLWNNDYDNCIKYADKIIDFKKKKADEKKYSETDFKNVNGYPLINYKIRDNRGGVIGYDFNQIFVTGNSIESIFELNFDGGSYGVYNVPVSNIFGADGRVPLALPSKFLSQLVSEKETEKVFEKKNSGYDGRLFQSVMYSSDGTPMYINKYTSSGGVIFSNSNTPYKVASYTIRYGVYGKDQESRNNSNYIIYRLSDIMLLKAEALALKIKSEAAIESGSDDEKLFDEAFDLVDAVNRRALMQETPTARIAKSDYTDKKELLDLVYDERNRELLFEGKRYFDLVRRSMREGNSDYLAAKASNRDENKGAYIASFLSGYQKGAIFWPVNLDEMKANENLKQNEAFGSGESSSMKNSAN